MIYGVDIGSRRIAIAGPNWEMAVLRLPDPPTGKGMLTVAREVELLGGFVAAVIPNDAVVWVEEPFMGAGNSNIRTAIRLGMTAGAVLSAHHGPGYVFGQQVWKAAVVGNGSAGKPQVTQWLWDNDPASAEACNQDQDLIDACCIRRYGVMVAEGRVEEPWAVSRRRRRADVRARKRAADERQAGVKS